MKLLTYIGLLTVFMLVPIPGLSQMDENPTVISTMITADVPESPTRDQALIEEGNLEKVHNEFKARNLPATIFSTEDLAKTRVNLLLTIIGVETKSELAMSGNHSGEKLSTIPISDQKQILSATKKAVETAKICGKNEITVKGFMPQSFDQNEDTYKVLDDLGLLYDAGFQAGVLYAPGHENDVWPYMLEGHKFYAVPASTYTLSEQKTVLHDLYFKDNGLGASKWYDALVGKLDEIQGKDEPLVIILTASVSSSDEYLDALTRFMDYAESKNANFVTGTQLVEMAKTGAREVSKLPVINESGECLTCGQESAESINITAINETV